MFFFLLPSLQMSVLGPDAEQAEVDVAAGGFMTPEGAPHHPPPFP